MTEAFSFDAATHTYRLGERRLLGVTEILKDNGFIEFPDFVSDEVLERARDRGQDVHAARHLLDQGRLDWSTVADDIGGYIESYVAWRNLFRGIVVASEVPLVHRVYGFAGTPDMVYQFERPMPTLGIRPLIDLKGGAWCAWHELQTAAYETLYNMNAAPNMRATARATLYLNRDGRPAKLEQHKEPTDLRAFLAAQQLTEWRKHHAKPQCHDHDRAPARGAGTHRDLSDRAIDDRRPR